MKYTIIDYGMGNLHSVKNAFDFLEKESEITNNPEKINSAQALILPGVGAFPDAISALREKELFDLIIKKAKFDKTPLFGICLGMQLLLTKSYEFRECGGLNLIEGECQKIKAENLKIPHIGWNDLTFDKKDSIMLSNIKENSYVYFVHSFKCKLKNSENLTAHTIYGEEIAAIIEKENVFGAQFHPEKSEKIGLEIIANFCNYCER